MSIYILVKWSLFQIKDRGETKNIANKHLFRLTAASCKPLLLWKIILKQVRLSTFTRVCQLLKVVFIEKPLLC